MVKAVLIIFPVILQIVINLRMLSTGGQGAIKTLVYRLVTSNRNGKTGICVDVLSDNLLSSRMQRNRSG